jgi:hypothetical protein
MDVGRLGIRTGQLVYHTIQEAPRCITRKQNLQLPSIPGVLTLIFILSRTLLRIFEYWQVRVKSEHAMGYIKGRFSSLRGLRQQIGDVIDHKRALAWVKTCIIIHTLISFVEEGDEDNEFMEELVREGRDAPDDVIVGHADTGRDQSDSQREAQGQRKRTELKTMLFESLYT